ncbi:MAG: OmpH family outer membrane protein [Bacteriovoracaceae bacterium]|nr:OmpH family outer membrane protein [Bacteriovoracaceae bacterium]
MKLLAFVLAAGLMFSATAAEFAKVDLEKVKNTIKQGQSVKAEIEKEIKKKEDDLKNEEKKIMKMREDFEKQSAVMADKAKREQEEKIQKAIMGVQQKYMQYQGELQKLQESKEGPILERLKEVIETVGKDAKVDIVFETQSTAILYARDIKDLTDDVIKAYDKKYKK